MPKKSNVQVLIGFVDSNEFSESRKKITEFAYKLF